MIKLSDIIRRNGYINMDGEIVDIDRPFGYGKWERVEMDVEWVAGEEIFMESGPYEHRWVIGGQAHKRPINQCPPKEL